MRSMKCNRVEFIELVGKIPLDLQFNDSSTI